MANRNDSRPNPDDDYYGILELPRNANDDDIRRAYRRQALLWHPDKHSGETRVVAEKRFKQISEAYEVLHDQTLRQKYDKWGADAIKNPSTFKNTHSNDFGSFESVFMGGGDPFGAFHDFSSFGEDFFSDIRCSEASRGNTRNRNFFQQQNVFEFRPANDIFREFFAQSNFPKDDTFCQFANNQGDGFDGFFSPLTGNMSTCFSSSSSSTTMSGGGTRSTSKSISIVNGIKTTRIETVDAYGNKSCEVKTEGPGENQNNSQYSLPNTSGSEMFQFQGNELRNSNQQYQHLHGSKAKKNKK